MMRMLSMDQSGIIHFDCIPLYCGCRYADNGGDGGSCDEVQNEPPVALMSCYCRTYTKYKLFLQFVVCVNHQFVCFFPLFFLIIYLLLTITTFNMCQNTKYIEL